MIRIAWQSKTKDAAGRGEWMEDDNQDELQSSVEDLNKQYPDLLHWIEKK